MKQKIALLFTALLLSGFAQAQVSKESYEKAVDWLNYKTVELSLIESPKKGVTKQFQDKCNCQDNPNYDSIKGAIPPSGNKTISLSVEINNLKDSFQKNWEKEDVVTFLSESIFTDKKYQEIVTFADKRKEKPKFDKYKKELKEELEDILVENVPPETATPVGINGQKSNSASKDGGTEPEKVQNKSNHGGFLGWLADYLIIYAILLGIIALFFGLRKQRAKPNDDALKDKSSKNQKMNSHSQSPDSSIDSNSNSRIQDLERSTTQNLRILKEKIDKNKRLLEKLESELEEMKKQIDALNSVLRPTTQSSYREEAPPETFFLSTPNSDGSFNESSAQPTYREGGSIYRFTKIGRDIAKFQIDEREASVKLALQYPDKNIDPVCEVVNAFNPKATRIMTIEQGEAKLGTNKWLVNKKSKIRYEN